MTQEELLSKLDEDLNTPAPSACDAPPVKDRTSVKDMILRFEKTLVSDFSGSTESLERTKEMSMGSFNSIVDPIEAHFQHLTSIPGSQNRNSNISVSSILSNASEVSYESGSSGFISDRKSAADGVLLKPHRPAPPVPDQKRNSLSVEYRSHTRDEKIAKERRFSATTPSSSPVVMRRSRQPPVIRKKSSAGQAHPGETLWSYGVKLGDLEKLLRLKRSEVSDNEQDLKSDVDNASVVSSCGSSDSISDNENVEVSEESKENIDETRADAISTDHSVDTLINENSGDEGSDQHSNYDNVSVKSLCSFDMGSYQNYDSITVSSDEFGSEACSAPDSEFLTVSAVNEWCVSKASEPQHVIIESKKEKYRRQLTERVNELLHTEHAYVDRLRHVVEDYIPAMSEELLAPSFRKLKPEIFGNIERIYRFHSEEFLPELRECEHDLRKLGRCFRKHEERFNMYVMYSKNNKRATRLVFEHKQFFQDIQHELGDRLDLSSYLLEPVQRIPRYKLFLSELVKTYTNYDNEKSESDSRISKLSLDSDETGGSNGETSDFEETPLESLKIAQTTIECLLTAVDGLMALDNITDCPPHLNLLSQGRLLRHGEFVAMDHARKRRQLMRIFLFDKVVLITVVCKKQTAVEYFIYKDHILVDDLGITAKEQDSFKFTIWYKKRTLKSFKLETIDPAIRHAWVEEITSLLWEQAMQKKNLLLQQRDKRISTASMNNQNGETPDNRDDKYNSLRGVPGEVRRFIDKKVRQTTWYFE